MRLKYSFGLVLGLGFTSSISAQAPPGIPQTPSAVPKTAPVPGQVKPGQVQPGTTQPATVAGVNPYPNSLHQMNDVSKTLNLTPDQMTSLNKLTEQTQAKYRDDYAKLNTLNDAERFARTQELNRQYYSTWNTGARDVFNDTQRNRYQQYSYQYGGFNTLYEPDVQKRLNLTTDQLNELRTQSDWNNQQLQEVNRLGATDPAKGTQAYQTYWTARQERFNKLLTADQQKAWRELTGEPYTFQPSFQPAR